MSCALVLSFFPADLQIQNPFIATRYLCNFTFYTKIVSFEMMRRVVIGSFGAAALIPSVIAATPIPEGSTEPTRPQPMKPSELPIYEAPHAEYAEFLQDQAKSKKESVIKSTLLVPISAVRQQAQNVWEQTDSIKHSVEDSYHDLSDKSEWLFKYFREEDNKEVRYGAVAMGGLTGFIFGLRGGIVRRLFYAGLGTTGMGFVCFPEDTKEILDKNSVAAKQYMNIAYNFFYGVKPGDPQLEIKFPELSFPKDLKELTDMAMSLGCTIYRAVMPPPAKEEKPADPPKSTDKKE